MYNKFVIILIRKKATAMYNVGFYRDRNGNVPVLEFIESLEKGHDKNSRINLTKVRDYIKILAVYGTRAGDNYVKHLDGAIWELRPLRNRILFVSMDEDGFVLLHQFVKKTQKTPAREIEQAKREYQDILERRNSHE